METSKATSELLKFRASNVVDKRMEIIKKSYLDRDFETFGRITMKDSNQFHATCLDTYPPIFYMNDTSSNIIKLIHVINNFYGKIIAAYTFDAGPNAVIYTLTEYIPILLAIFSKFFPLTNNLLNLSEYCNKPNIYMDASNNANNMISKDFMCALNKTGIKGVAGDIKYCFVTKPGPEPVKQPIEECIIDLTTGGYKSPSDKHKRLNIGATPTSNTNNTTTSTTNNNTNNTKKCQQCCSSNQLMQHVLLGVGILAAVGVLVSRKCCRK